MGGRGQRWTPGGGGNSSANFQEGALGVAVPSTLKEALGTKGAAMSINEAMDGANPGYNPAYGEYSENCQRAVVAYELRRRGYDVSALPTYDGDNLPYVAHVDANGVKSGYWMGAFQNLSATSVAASTNKSVANNIESQMKEYGNGARAIVQVKWQGGNSGHVMNLENVNGKIRVVDAQVGRTTTNLTQALSGSKPSETQIVRTDNLKVSDRAKKSVTQRKKITG